MIAPLAPPAPSPEQLRQAIGRAWRARRALHEDPTVDAYRVFHGWTEGVPDTECGLEIDRYGSIVQITYRPRAEPQVELAAGCLTQLAPFDAIVAKVGGPTTDKAELADPAAVARRPRAPYVVRGTMPAEPVIVSEHGLRFRIAPWRPRNPGLFLDARPARRWILANSEGRRVLNLFAFTGSLGVAAARGGARRVVHVDSQQGALDRCLANHELNGVPTDARDLARLNIRQHLKRAAARRQRWDGVICDPPPVSDSKAQRKPSASIERLAALVAPTLEPGGWLVCFFHHSPRTWDEHEAAVREAAGVSLDILWRSTSGDDFPERELDRKLRMTAFVRR